MLCKFFAVYTVFYNEEAAGKAFKPDQRLKLESEYLVLVLDPLAERGDQEREQGTRFQVLGVGRQQRRLGSNGDQDDHRPEGRADGKINR